MARLTGDAGAAPTVALRRVLGDFGLRKVVVIGVGPRTKPPRPS
jgi:hypothetical protein